MELTREVRDRRVAIAKDVLLQMGRTDVPLNVVKGGGYISGGFGVRLDVDDSIQPHVDAIQLNCSVCAKGAMLLSRARLYNAVSAGVILSPYINSYASADNEDIMASLADDFDPFTLDMIEAVFERSSGHAGEWEGSNYTQSQYQQFHAAAAFGRKIHSPADRVRICRQSLIDNDGELVLPTQVSA